MTEKEQQAQFQQWLVFYITGRLGEHERRWMEQYITDHPQATGELKIEKALKETLQAELPQFAPEQGLNAFMTRIRAETNSSKTSHQAKSWKKFMDNCRRRLGLLFTSPGWAMAVTLLLVQTGVIGMLLTNRTAPIITTTQTEWRSVGNADQGQGPVLQITFKSTTTEEEIRLLLVKIRGSLVGGPGQLGNYIVKVPVDNIEEARIQVLNSPIIEAVSVLPEPPVER